MSELFTHAAFAEQAGANPCSVIRRLRGRGQWKRWLALIEDVPLSTGLLYYAANQGLLSWVESMACEGVYVSDATLHELGAEAVMEAGMRRNSGALELLLQHFPYNESCATFRSLPLPQVLVWTSDVMLLQTFLLQAGKRPNASPPNTQHGGTTSVPGLNQQDLDGQTALHVAVARRDTVMASEILRYHPDMLLGDRLNQTALHMACSNETVSDWRCFATWPEWWKRAAPSESIRKVATRSSMVELLLVNGASVKAKTSTGRTPLHTVCEMIPEPRHSESVTSDCFRGDPEADIITLLLQHGADVNAQSVFGQTPLHIACGVAGGGRPPLTHTLAVVKRLLDAGANPNARDAANKTPLHYATANSSDRDIVAELLHRGADIMAPSRSGKVALHYAAELPYPDVVSELLAHPNQIVDQPDNKGRTPLHILCDFTAVNHEIHLEGHLPVMRQLLNRGAQVHSVKDRSGSSPFDVAATHGVGIVIDLLKELGGDPPPKATSWATLMDMVGNLVW